MKVESIIKTKPHTQITTWVNAAVHQAYEDIRSLLRDESTQDVEWFLSGRKGRLDQLSNEIFSLKLMDASEGRWLEQDFEGRQHSTVITKALADLRNRVAAEYRRLATQLSKVSV